MTVVGIDLGTTNSLVATWQGEKPVIIPNVHGENLTPSVVSVDDSGEVLVGKAAKERLITHPKHSAETFKRKIGSNAQFQLGQHKFSPVELSTLILKSLKQDAETFLGESVTEAIISVPAYFNDIQRNATKAAAEMAGLKVERLINEPTAAALAYGLHDTEDESTFIVVDLGGGTFDVSLMELFDGVMEVHASAGDTFLGGEDFTSAVENYLFGKYEIDSQKLTAHEKSLTRSAANQLKHQLTNVAEATATIHYKKRELELHLTRDQFENLAQSLIARLRSPIERVLRDANLRPSSLSDIILVGGATRMPIIRSAISKMFRRLPSCNINPDEVVVIGAAIQAALKTQNKTLKDTVLTDICPYTLGVEIALETGKSGNFEAGQFMPIIERNSVIPVSKMESVYTLQDGQTHVEIKIYQGESRLVNNNLFLGKLTEVVPKGKAGSEGIDIRFTYDINGILEVETHVISSGVKQNKIIEKSPGALSKEEISASLRKLQNIKIHPRDTEQNRAALAKAERIYEQQLGERREYVAHLVRQFEAVLQLQDADKADSARVEFISVLNEIDGNIFE